MRHGITPSPRSPSERKEDGEVIQALLGHSKQSDKLAKIRSFAIKDSKFSDISVKACGQVFKLHRIILIANPYFEAMLLGPLSRETEDAGASQEVELALDDPLIDGEALAQVFWRIYGGSVDLSKDVGKLNVLGLLAAANYFNEPELVDNCVRFIESSLSRDTVVPYLEFTDTRYYGTATDQIIDSCLSALCRDGYDNLREAMHKLPLRWICRIVASDCFFAPTEEDRYEFVKEVIEARRTQRTIDGISSMKLSSSEHSFSSLDTIIDEADRSTTADGKESEDATELLDRLIDSIALEHLKFSQLLKVRSEGIFDEKVVHQALWRQKELEDLIVRVCVGDYELGLNNDEDDAKNNSKVPAIGVPRHDTADIDSRRLQDFVVGAVPAGLLSATRRFAPYRFAFEISIDELENGYHRFYSPVHFYGGSLWGVYLQQWTAVDRDGMTNPKVGIYVQRWHVSDKHLPGDEVAAYVDNRVGVKAWYRITCFFPSTSYVLESKPEVFKSKQSWGWKSNKLHWDVLEGNSTPALTRETLRFVVVIGLV